MSIGFAVVSIGKRAGCFAFFVFLVSHDCVWLFLMVPLVCLRFVIVVFPNYTHLLFLVNKATSVFIDDKYLDRAVSTQEPRAILYLNKV